MFDNHFARFILVIHLPESFADLFYLPLRSQTTMSSPHYPEASLDFEDRLALMTESALRKREESVWYGVWDLVLQNLLCSSETSSDRRVSHVTYHQPPLRHVPGHPGKIPDLCQSTVVQTPKIDWMELHILILEAKRNCFVDLLPLAFYSAWQQVAAQVRNAFLKMEDEDRSQATLATIATVGQYWSYMEWVWEDAITILSYFQSEDSVRADGEYQPPVTSPCSSGGSSPLAGSVLSFSVQDDPMPAPDDDEDEIVAADVKQEGIVFIQLEMASDITDPEQAEQEEVEELVLLFKAEEKIDFDDFHTVENLAGLVFTIDSSQGRRALDLIRRRLVDLHRDVWYPPSH